MIDVDIDLDPDLAPFFSALPDVSLRAETVNEVRALFHSMIELGEPSQYGVQRRELTALMDNAVDVPCILYEPLNQKKGLLSKWRSVSELRPAILQIHGGGTVFGSAIMNDLRHLALCERLQIPILCVDYRLAPENPYPAGLDDCETALRWFVKNASVLNIDPARIAVSGDSAGGGLAAALVQRVRGDATLNIAFQHLVYPMLDDRTTGDGADIDPRLGRYLWTPENNRFAWSAYLDDTPPGAPAVPGRAVDLEGLPPCWIGVGGLDLFLDENISYARRLTAAGVATEVHIYPSAPHGFNLASDAPVARRFFEDCCQAFQRGLKISADK